jgi:hypothetical protein
MDSEKTYNTKLSDLKDEPISPRIVASLTTVPERIQYLPEILKYLIGQKIPFSRIYLHIPYQSLKKKHYMIPSHLGKFAGDNGIIINRTSEDLGPITKLIPVLKLEKDPETIIVTFDDDVLVHPEVSSILLRKCQEYSNACLSFSGWCVGGFPYLYQLAIKNDRDVACDWLQGVHSIAYRRKFLDEQEIINFPNRFPGRIKSLLKMNDDHWISAYLEEKKIPKLSIGYPAREFFQNLVLPDSDKSISSQGGFWTGVHDLSTYFRSRNIYKREFDSQSSVVYLSGILIMSIIIGLLVISRLSHTSLGFGLSVGFLILFVIFLRHLIFRIGFSLRRVQLGEPIVWGKFGRSE